MTKTLDSQYRTPLVTVDNVLFTVIDSKLKVLLVKRACEPYIGQWSLPGGFIDPNIDQSAEATAIRKLQEKTAVIPPYLEQLQTFSGHTRDPRDFSVTLVYFALIAAQKVSPNIATVEDVNWWDVDAIDSMSLAFDHQIIIRQAILRLQHKTLYSMVPVYCLPDKFTITELKVVIEAILGKTIQRKSLIRRIETAGMFEVIDEKVQSGGRFAQLYKLRDGVEVAHFESNLRL